MTFTFDPTLSSALSQVRFHIGDVSADGAYLQDETINALLASEGSIGGAVIACIKHIITQLSVPTFRQDWLSVDYAAARKAFEELLRIKAQEFGIPLATMTTRATIGLPYRADSYQYTDQPRMPASDETSVHDGSP